MSKKYSDCFYCGGAVEERLGRRELHWKGKLYIFENVPMGVCTQCGEKVIKPAVAKSLDRILLKNQKPEKEIKVPVYSYLPEAG